MSEHLTLSIDAMGGDNAPEMVVAGINLSRRQLPDVDYILFGNEQMIAPLLDKYPHVKDCCRIVHTSDIVSDDEKPSVALRQGRQSSMRLAINAVGDGEANGVISAGNTGALMAMAKFVLKTLPGISRPAIATYFPTQRGESLMLDLGANVLCDADNLVQFAVMGEVFARNVLGLEQPSVGLLNVGTEDLKGHESIQQAAEILKNTSLPIKFHGFVEGDDIGAGTVDVVVTDGFTGNIALKATEGTAKLVGKFLKDALTSTPVSKLGAVLARKALNEFRMKMDPRRYNGAMFLGLNGICIKSHGGTDEIGFSNAIGVAVELITDGLNDGIKEDFAQLNSNGKKEQAAAV
ncbi:MAG: phosphate acyltransferase PlsX [Rhodospirillales bacterium]|nr:phosphate acyltransferase PlsX [Rhodospirillales bacterium]